MGFQMQICSILSFSPSILVVLCSSANELQQNSNASSREECNKIFHKYVIDCFVMDSSRLNYTSFVCHS